MINEKKLQGKIFGVLEANKGKFKISDYSVSQTTLDQVIAIPNRKRLKKTDSN
jgi:hypothetical protein